MYNERGMYEYQLREYQEGIIALMNHGNTTVLQDLALINKIRSELLPCFIEKTHGVKYKKRKVLRERLEKAINKYIRKMNRNEFDAITETVLIFIYSTIDKAMKMERKNE